MPSAKHLAEYMALRAIAAVVYVLPGRAAAALGWGLAWLAFHLARARVREACRRIREVFGTQYDERAVRRIAWRSWRNVALTGVEMLRVGRMTPARLRATTNLFEACAPVVEHVRTGRGGLIATCHMSNWEMAAVGAHYAGVPIFSVAARQRNPLTNAYMNRLRNAPGIDSIERGDGTMKAVMRRIREGGVLAILPDVRMRTPGVSVPFLGGTANVGPGMALFARHNDVPIFPAIGRRTDWTRHVFRTLPPVLPDKSLDKAADVERMTRHVMALIEDAIRQEPEQWFWYNQRWILEPVERAP